MANSNFVVQNGLQVGPLTIDAATGSISTTGTVDVGGIAVSAITKGDSSITINDTGTGSNISFVIDGTTEHVMTQSLTTLNGNLFVNSTGYMTVPSGTSAERPGSASNGMMRYNSDITSFEGYYAGAWSSLGGVKSVDGKAYITAEASAGAGDDVIRVYAGDSGTSTQVMWASTSNISILPTTVSTNSTTGALQVAGGAGIAGALNVGGTTGLTGALTYTTATGGGLQAIAIGNVTPGSGAFTTGAFSSTLGVTGATTLTTATTGGLQAVAIGNVTPGSGAFTTLTASGITQITNATNSTGPTTGAFQVTGGASIGGNVYIAGNLTVAGTQTTFNTNNVTISDSLLYIADDNTGDILDIGLVGSFTNPGYQHTGFVRDASDGVWKLFANVVTEPSTTIDFTFATYSPIRTGAITASTLNASGVITSTVTTGTAPFTVSSTTAVTNLNADLWDGNQFADYINQAIKTTSSPTFAGVTLPSITKNGTNGVGDIGQSGQAFATVYATTFSGVSTTAKYADLAENYQADKFYNPGTVLMFGGANEVTLATADTTAVAGVVSTNPAHLMNGALSGPSVAAVALTGRVPCNVIGPVKKGDMMVSAGFGFAKASTDPKVGTVIGKALEDFPMSAKGVIEVVVGRV